MSDALSISAIIVFVGTAVFHVYYASRHDKRLMESILAIVEAMSPDSRCREELAKLAVTLSSESNYLDMSRVTTKYLHRRIEILEREAAAMKQKIDALEAEIRLK